MKCLYFIYLLIAAVLNSFVRSEFIYSCKENRTIALTFDDGPHQYSKHLVDYLKTQPDVKVTFFTVGKFHYPYATEVSEYQNAMKKAHDAGFQIASHTYKHKIPDDEYAFKETLEKMDNFIEKVTGDRPRYFRAPKGHCNSGCQENLTKWGYKLIQWDVDTNDWDLEGAGSASRRVEKSIEILKKKFSKEKDNYLVLMHDTEEYTVNEIVPWIIEKSGMREKGYRFVSVAECLGDVTSMYASKKVYGNHGIVSNDPVENNLLVNGTETVTKTSPSSVENPKNDTVISNVQYNHVEYTDPTESVVYYDNLQHLNSGAFLTKPKVFLSFLWFGLLGLFMFLRE